MVKTQLCELRDQFRNPNIDRQYFKFTKKVKPREYKAVPLPIRRRLDYGDNRRCIFHKEDEKKFNITVTQTEIIGGITVLNGKFSRRYYDLPSGKITEAVIGNFTRGKAHGRFDTLKRINENCIRSYVVNYVNGKKTGEAIVTEHENKNIVPVS
jgi:hypothetical protein